MLKNNQPIEPARSPSPDGPANTWKHMIVFLCIWFFVVVLVLVYFSATGTPQAGLIEVGVSALIFVSLFLLIMKFFPSVSKIFTSVIVIGFGIALILVNYHFLKVVKKDASVERLLVGDLLISKIVKTFEKGPVTVATQKKIPKATPTPMPTPKYERPLPPPTLDQLQRTIAGPTTAKLELLQVAHLAPVVKGGPMFIVEKRKVELPEYEKSSPVISLNELKKMILDPTTEELELSHITTLVPVLKAGSMSIAEELKLEAPVMNMEISAPGFSKACESTIQEVLERKSRTFLPFLECIREVSNLLSEEPKILSPVSETLSSVQVISLHEPLKEGRVPIN